jgi:hypothetical protein
MDEIKELQYENLRECFKKNLVNPILGDGYYNTAMDVYSCDALTTEHLKNEFNERESCIKRYRNLFVLSLLVNLVFILMKVIK